MRRAQGGFNVFGFLFLLGIIGLVVVAGLRVGPLYMEAASVGSVFADAKEKADAEPDTVSPGMVRRWVQNGFMVNDIDRLNSRDVTIEEEDDTIRVYAEWEARTPLFYNLDAIAKFERTIEIDR